MDRGKGGEVKSCRDREGLRGREGKNKMEDGQEEGPLNTCRYIKYNKREKNWDNLSNVGGQLLSLSIGSESIVLASCELRIY